ncbi:MAG: transcription termination/antitermination protein NusA [Candidatus Moranbacteria bacterium CG_4_10_14_3_um_filter_44_15]|nr:MAG: transcription termination/antitermination protein NusA [Candidatus Moranbacteria bacterium CG06_land_8_20_14_3_00_43_56]PIV83543.1 MAG: transcription termination/antitermination protein NusA [Candidatus Moranbacteria bacterium CG17_big_fil_post_rev_8_21_14_2_50_44_12]PIW93349.1 MAG: transcription termination/antitermination protein NusA [Candidatus Moranbacteria bacterium CG_4_8_14_3_um_filter_43_15]PIX91130.1 MAG: transcription termination/antitermination protein NusA [Candidatus Moranb
MAKRKKITSENDPQPAGRLGQFGSAIAQICEEKGISKEKVVEAIESALAAAYKKDYGRRGQHIRAEFNEVTGGADFYLVKEVVDETTRIFETEESAQKTSSIEGDKENKAEAKKKDGEKSKEVEKVEGEEEIRIPHYNSERDLTLEEAKKIKPDAKVGDIIETKLESKSDYGRVAAQTAKQVIIQKIREAERDAMYDEYKQKEGEAVSGIIQRIEGRNIFVDLGKSTGVLFPSEQVENEKYRIGQRLKVYVMKVEADPKGPGIILSRSHPVLVQKLFEIEVPEIFAGTVEIKSMAREAGFRTKVAVASNEEGVDPIGSCVGQKGTRVQAVIDELGGEKIDIIEWSDDVAKFISNALSPAKVLNVKVNEAKKEARVSIPADQLSLAIGKQGQNVRLAAKLTGWKIDVVAGGEKKEEGEKESEEIKEEKTEADGKEAKKEKKEKAKKNSDSGEKEEKSEEKE